MTSSVLRVVIVGWNAFQRLYLAAGLPPLAVRLEENPGATHQPRRVPKRSEGWSVGPHSRSRGRETSNPNEWLRSSAIRLLALLVRSGPPEPRSGCLGRHASQSANAPELGSGSLAPLGTPVRAGCRSTLRDGTPSGRPPECWGRREPPGRTRSGGVSTLRSVAKPPRPQGAP